LFRVVHYKISFCTVQALEHFEEGTGGGVEVMVDQEARRVTEQKEREEVEQQ
jgi:hypothetical protein